MNDRRGYLLILFLAFFMGCSLFEPREPEPPSQSGSAYIPPTTPEIVIANLKSSIEQKNSQNYIRCFADPSESGLAFKFIPSVEAAAEYPNVLNSWTYSEEYDYIVNLVSKAMPGGFSNLLLTETSPPIVTADSVIYTYDYTLTFQHTEPGFPSTAQGSLQFALGVDNRNFWSIYRWSDFKTTQDISWSSFKGKFSN